MIQLERTLIEQAKHYFLDAQSVFQKMHIPGAIDNQEFIAEFISAQKSCETIVILAHFRDSGLSHEATQELCYIEQDLTTMISQLIKMKSANDGRDAINLDF